MTPNDTVKHTIFTCSHWADYKTRLTGIVKRELKLKDAKDFICEPMIGLFSEDTFQVWNLLAKVQRHQSAFVNIVDHILASKEQKEKGR